MILQETLAKERQKRNWKFLYQVEQDILLDRALVSMYQNEHIQNTLVFRGGTALNKLFIDPAARFSEDLDFVQLKPAPIGITLDAIRKCMEWFLKDSAQIRPRINIGRGGVKILYTFTNIDGTEAGKLKIEINTKEHFHVAPLKRMDFATSSEYFKGRATIVAYSIDELMGTKLRALYQRRKGRDLFDIWYVLSNNLVDMERVIHIFHKYNEYNGINITRKMFTQNILDKQNSTDFRADIRPLLSPKNPYSFDMAFDYVLEKVLPFI
ncbi:MAG: nucleotidyl transferase AbiEii/AbiGii toxin family protein [Bacteroidota bacterium]